MSLNEHQVFQETMGQLEKDFQARHIWSTPLFCCQAQVLAKEALLEHEQYDQIAVANGASIVGVLLRDAAVDGQTAETCMCRLGDDFLTSADQPLLPLLHDLLAPPYFRLVVDGGRIQGIVTRSDVPKLPVRLLAFALVAHVESILAQMISRRCPDNDSLYEALGEQAAGQLRKDLKKYQERRADPSAVEFLTFNDKIEVAKKLYRMTAQEAGRLHTVRELRNHVDHLNDFAYDIRALATFVDGLSIAQKWIGTRRYQF